MTKSVYSYLVQKDKASYRIAVKNLSKKAVVQYVTGYQSAEAALADTGRLDEHLQSNKRFKTFEKNTEEDWLLPLKKQCIRPEPKKNCSEKREYSGQVLIAARKRLHRRYWLYKTKCLTEKEAFIMSRVDFIRKDKEDSDERIASSLLEDAQNSAVGRALKYLRGRLSVIDGRLKKNAELISDMLEHVYSGNCFRKIIESKKEELDDTVIDLTKEEMTLESTSKAQLTRVMLQCLVVTAFLQEINKKLKLERVLVTDALDDANLKLKRNEKDSALQILKDHEVQKNKFRWLYSMAVLSEEVAGQTGKKISPKTALVWYNEYVESGGFKEDTRGVWDRESFLEEYGYKLRFEIYLKNQRKMTVDVATRDLEALIAKDPPKSAIGILAFNKLRPFRRSTVHRWMLRCGCKYEKATISYYTDSHEAESTKKDLKERCSNLM